MRSNILLEGRGVRRCGGSEMTIILSMVTYIVVTSLPHVEISWDLRLVVAVHWTRRHTYYSPSYTEVSVIQENWCGEKYPVSRFTIICTCAKAGFSLLSHRILSSVVLHRRQRQATKDRSAPQRSASTVLHCFRTLSSS